MNRKEDNFFRVGNLLFGSSLFWSKSQKLKSDHEWFAQVRLNKRATMSKLLRLLLSKEWPWEICSGRSLQKSDLSKSLKNEWFARRNSEKWLFCMNSFPSFEPKSALLLSLFAHLLFFKEQPWAILFKKERLRDSLKKRMNHTFFSFAHTKKTNLLKKPMSEFPTLDFF